MMVFEGSSPITTTSPSSKAHQKSGPFAPPALPGFNAPTTLSESRHGRRPFATLRPLPSPVTGLPRLLEPPFRRAVPTTPADRAGARVDCFPCRFRKLHPLDSRSPANQNMIAGCSLLPSFSSACCATVSSRDDGLKPKSWCCGINSMFCSSARHIGYV